MGLVQPNRTHFANHAGERYLFSKPHVFEADMHDANVRRRVPALARFFEDAATALPDAFAEADTRAEAGTSQTSRKGKHPPLSLLARGDLARTVKRATKVSAGVSPATTTTRAVRRADC